jgi:hypothetical protein
MTKMYIIVLAALLLMACSNEPAQKLDAELTVAEITMSTGDYVDQTVSLTGTVNHVCKHGGKRLFLMSLATNDRFKVEAGEVGSFDATLEGSEIKVVGVVKELKVDKAYLDNWEKEVCAAEAENEAQKYADNESHAQNEHAENPTLQNINNLRSALAESEGEHLSFYHLEAISFEEVM